MANQHEVNDWLTLEVLRVISDEEGLYFVTLSNFQIVDCTGLNLPRRPRVCAMDQGSMSRSGIRLIND